MAKKISQLTQATEVKSDDVTVIVQDGETKKLPLNMMVTKQDIENKKVAGLAKLDEIEATYENDTYTPTITVENKSSVKTGEGDEVDYSANVMDGHVKSAILKGQTLVNLATPIEFKSIPYHGYCLIINGGMLKSGTYTLKSSVDFSQYVVNLMSTQKDKPSQYRRISIAKNGVFTIDDTFFVANGVTTEDFFICLRPVDNPSGGTVTTNEIENAEFILLEGDYTDVDIPYFTGMQSVKMPVLTTVGKNIFNGETDRGYIEPSTGQNSSAWNDLRSAGYVEVIGGLKIRGMVTHGTWNNIRIYEYDANKNFIGGVQNNTLSGNARYVRFSIGGNINVSGESQVMLYYGEETANTYEPYKSNILSCLEPVELGSVGEVKDELNLLTQQLTQRTETRPYQEGDELNSEFVTDMTNTRYKLAQEVVKTVDLMPSGTHPSTTPYCWKNGHIQLSSSGLLPNLEYSVVTSRAGQINQNATMIVKNDKRIFDLEILLAGGLVNTTYQALTLQNQVETGLSKVSLNSETEPDYLLYHMIMKLIEEKAYKLDDLTEKVSVFYLYEKLSDEQFETIYSALYPFAEDEIIEEPVVEELPEVVEDEVIM